MFSIRPEIEFEAYTVLCSQDTGGEWEEAFPGGKAAGA